MRRALLARAAILAASTAPLLVSCDADVRQPTAFDLSVRSWASGTWRANGTMRVGVWVCHVPPGSTNELYGGLPLRRALTPDGVAAAVSRRVPDWFRRISGGRLDVRVTAGGEVTLSETGGTDECVTRALSEAGDVDVVLAVADAEHAPGQQGGFGSGGEAGAAAGPASRTRRWAYIGASDFNPDWGDDPPMDLVEHELGHTLGWVHSGMDEGPPAVYSSPLDVMSDSAAPRRVDPARRDAPDTLAIDRVIAGWLPADRIAQATTRARTVTLTPASAADGTALLVLETGDVSFLTVELLVAEGDDAHLPHDGVVVHRVAWAGATDLTVDPVLVAGDALMVPGTHVDVDGWSIEVGDHWVVSARPKN